jgi:uncharacterized damage-inducible protein DinB
MTRTEALLADFHATDETLLQASTLLSVGRKVFSMPRGGVIRNMVMDHFIHHRGQLTMYMRLNNIPVPGLYGPSADEK